MKKCFIIFNILMIIIGLFGCGQQDRHQEALDYIKNSHAPDYKLYEDYVICESQDEVILVKYYGTMSDLIIPSKITKIADHAFSNDEYISNVTIPSSVKSIGRYAFRRSSLKSVNIPASVEVIDEWAFADCGYLENVDIENGITAINDGAFDNCRSLKEVFIPFSVKSIGNDVFCSCDILEKVTFGNNSELETIGDKVFKYSEELKYIEIPASVKKIGSGIFDRWNKSIGAYLKNINFLGTMEQWNAIEKASNWADRPLVIKCVDGDIK